MRSSRDCGESVMGSLGGLSTEGIGPKHSTCHAEMSLEKEISHWFAWEYAYLGKIEPVKRPCYPDPKVLARPKLPRGHLEGQAQNSLDGPSLNADARVWLEGPSAGAPKSDYGPASRIGRPSPFPNHATRKRGGLPIPRTS